MKLPWLRTTWAALMNSAQQKRLGHALSVPWNTALGSDQLVNTLSQWLLCQSENRGNVACGQCKSCLLWKAQTHPDLYTLGAIDETSIGVDAIRMLQASLSSSANQGGQKVAVISYAHLLTVAASNALLKTLEEPPANTTLIVASERWDALLPTIRSRVQHYQLTAPDVTQLAQWLSTYAEKPVQAEESLRFWCDKPLTALHKLQTGALQQGTHLPAILAMQPLPKVYNEVSIALAVIDELEAFIRDALWLAQHGSLEQVRLPRLCEQVGLRQALEDQAFTVQGLNAYLQQCYELRTQIRAQRGLNTLLALQMLTTPLVNRLQPYRQELSLN